MNSRLNSKYRHCSICVLFVSVLLSGAAAAEQAVAWPGQYKIRPWESTRLTNADVVGPDGIVYPDWTGVGVEGGIPQIDPHHPPANYTVYNVTGSDNAAVARAFAVALTNASDTRASIVHFPAGTYSVSSQCMIDKSGIVITGAGKDSTTIRIVPGGSGALFTIRGEVWGNAVQATATIHRGSNSATFTGVSGYRVGGWVRIVATNASLASATMRARYSKPEVSVVYDNAWNHFGRVFFAKITAINGTTVTFDRSFAHDVYLDESPQMRTAAMIEYCGIQDLTLETVSGASLDPVSLFSVANCWIKGVRFRKARNWPIASSSETRIRTEIRDCDFEGTWADINSGANAYLGWTQADMDCLMENCTAFDLRHMAIFQKASRCVVRNCTFFGQQVTSPQLHGRFPLENLVEGNSFSFSSSRGKTAFYSDPAHSLRHGPNGPRNVFYNNQVNQGAGCFFLGGAVENQILAYNRVLTTDDTEQYPPLLAMDRSFDGIFKGNHIQALATVPALHLEDLSCTGWFTQGNCFYGTNGSLWAGDGAVTVDDNNRFFEAGTPVGQSEPATESIYLWQRENASRPRLVLATDRSVLSGIGDTATLYVVRVKTPLTSATTVSLRVLGSGISVASSVTIPAGMTHAAVLARSTTSSGNLEGAIVSASASGLLSDDEMLYVRKQNEAELIFGLGRYATFYAGLPDNWRSADFGLVQTPGSVAESGGIWTIRGSGPQAQTFHGSLCRSGRRLVYQTLDGDGTFTARLDSVDAHGQVGLMITDDAGWMSDYLWIEANGRVLSSGYTPESHGLVREYAPAGSATVPVWLRLTRTGSVLMAEISTDGLAWVERAQIDLHQDNTAAASSDYKSQATLDNYMHVGMFLNSGTNSTLATAVFSNVSLDGKVVAYDKQMPPVANRVSPINRSVQAVNNERIIVEAFDLSGRRLMRNEQRAPNGVRQGNIPGMQRVSRSMLLLRTTRAGYGVTINRHLNVD